MNEKTELEVGQVYVEDIGLGITSNRIKLTRVGGVGVVYEEGSGRNHMLRNRFEGLVRAKVFNLVEVSTSELEKLRAENRELNVRLYGREQFVRERAELHEQYQLRIEALEGARKAQSVFGPDGFPTAGFQKDDVWLSSRGLGNVRVIKRYDRDDNRVYYIYRTSPKGTHYHHSLPVKEFEQCSVRESKLLRGRLTDYHCRCGVTCRGNDTQHWCINPNCEHVGQVKNRSNL